MDSICLWIRNSGSQNLADPTDPDPKHWYIVLYNMKIISILSSTTFRLDKYCDVYINFRCILCWKTLKRNVYCVVLKLNVYCVVQH